MKSFQEFLNEAGKGLEIHIGGDRYDGGVIVKAYSDGKQVDSQTLDGEQDYSFMKKKYDSYDSYAKALEKKYGGKAKRVTLK